MNQTKKKASQGAKRAKAILTYQAYVKMHVNLLITSNEDNDIKVEKFIYLLKQLRLDLVDRTRFDEYIVRLMEMRETFDKRKFKTMLVSFHRNFITCKLIDTLTPITSIEITIDELAAQA